MKKLFSYMMVCGTMMTAVLGFTSCEDDLDVQQAYPFTVETMPVPKRLVQGETAEIRCEIVREGYFSDTRYTIRYFQPDGEGTLRMDDGMVLLPNDRYPLYRDMFRLYYTSECEDQQTIDVYFEDNHDQLYQLTFIFNNEELDVLLEDQSLYWNDDKEIVDTFVLKTIKRFDEKNGANQPLLPEFKDEEDRDFARRLFRRSILNCDYYRHLISENTRNWDLDRVAFMDVVIMQCALAEILSFPNIPVSVSLNEYVDIAKVYSTTKSGSFVNGTLDGIVKELKKEGKLSKN